MCSKAKVIFHYLRAVRVLAVRDLYHDLHGAGVLVAEVLHAASDRVPTGPVGNAVSEVGLDKVRYFKSNLFCMVFITNYL